MKKIYNIHESFIHVKVILFAFLIVLSVSGYSQNCSINAGVPQSICENEVLTLYGQASGLFEANDTLVLWQQISGPSVVIVSPRSLTTDVLGTVAGETYEFRIWTICEDGSLIYQHVTNTILPITSADAGANQTVCPGTENLNANTTAVSETGIWSILLPNHGITINDYASPTSSITIDGNDAGVTRLIWTITNTNGCSDADTVEVTNLGGITPVDAGLDQTLDNCYSTTHNTTLDATQGGSGISGQIGTWIVVNGPNIPIIDDANDNNTDISNLIEGTYIFQWNVVGTCASGSDQVTITVPAPTSDVTDASDTNDDLIFCDGRTEVVLNGTAPEFTNETVQWTQTSGPTAGIVITNATNHIATVSGLDGTSNYRFSYTINNTVTACSSSAIVNISYSAAPEIDITPDAIELACEETSASIPYTSVGDGTESWQIISAPSGVIPPVDETEVNGNPQIINGLYSAGTYVIRFRKLATVGSTCETAFDDVVVTVSREAGLSNAGTDQLLACNVYQTVFAANQPSSDLGIGIWSQIAGPAQATIDNIYSSSSNVSFPANGFYKFRWIISNGAFCDQNEDDVIIVVANLVPNTPDAGPDQDVCINTPVYVDATQPVLNQWGYWEVIPDNAGVTFSDTSAYNTTVYGMNTANTTYQLIWTVENTCGSASDIVLVNTNDITGPVEADAGLDICLATGTTTFNLEGNDPYPGTGLWTQVNGSGATFGDDTSPTSSVTLAGDGTYYFEWAVSSGAACSPTVDTVRVTIAPDATVADAGPDQEVCSVAPATVTMAANTATSGVGGWIQISGAASTIDDELSRTTDISGLIEGVYRFAWVITNEVCSESADTVTLYISEPPVLAAAGSDMDLCGVSSATLAGNAVANGVWSLISGPNTATFSNATSATSDISGLIMGTYELAWTSLGGTFCPASSDTMYITVVPDADAGADQNYCEATTAVDLVGNVNSSGTWTEISAHNATTTTTSGNTATASDLVSGNVYQFQYEIDNGAGCQSTDAMTVTLETPPSTADAGSDQEWCDAATFTMAGNTPASGTGEWSLLYSPGGGTFSPDANTPDAEFTPTLGSKYGLFVFAWTISNGECSNADQVRIENFQPPSTADAGADQTVTCDTETYMDAENPAVGLGFWTLISQSPTAPVPNIVSPILYNSLITNLGPQTNGSPADYVFEWTVSNGSLCTPTTNQVTITVNEIPTTADAGADQEQCRAVGTTMDATASTTGSGNWTLVSGPNTPTITDASLATTTITNMDVGTYVFEWRVSTTFCSSADSITIVNYDDPSTPIDLADFSVCQFEDLILDTDAPTSGTGMWSQTAGDPVTILNPTSDSTRVVGVTPGNNYTFRWTVSNGVCADKSDDVTVTVNEEPVADDYSTTVCSGDALDINLLAQVTTPADVSGVTFTYEVASSDEANVHAAPDRDPATAANITDVYTNTTNNPVDITYTVTPITGDGCEGFPFIVTITINPEPNVSDQITSVCSQEALDYNLQNLLPAVEKPATFTYTVVSSSPGDVPAEGDRLTASGNNITHTYTNTTNASVDVTYTVTPISVDGCVGNSFDLVVTVNPEPVYTGVLLNTVCSDDIINAGLPDTDDDGLAIDAYNITAVVSAGLTGTPTEGNNLIGRDTISHDIFNNVTSGDLDVVYTIEPITGSCVGASFTSTITVRPEPVLTPDLTQVLCADAATANLSLTITNGLPGTTFTYNAPVHTGGITGGTGRNTGTAAPITDTYVVPLITQPGTVTYSVTPEAGNGCAGDVSDVVIVINPIGQVNNPGQQVFCNADAASVIFTTANSGGTTTYAWTNDNTSIGLDANGIGNLSFTAINFGISPISANITVTPTFENGGSSCSGTAETFTIVINPTGQAGAVSSQLLCNNTATTAVNFTTTNTGGTVTYLWTNDEPSIGLAANGTGDIASFIATNSGSDPLVANVVVTPYFEYLGVSCPGAPSNFTFTINPTPTVSSVSNEVVCSGGTLDYTPTSETVGTTFTWVAANTVGTVTGFTPVGTGPISDELTNANNTIGQVVYTITPTGPAPTFCIGPAFSLEVIIVNCNPVIGVSNQLVTTADNGDGTYDALFTIRVQNYGNVPLHDIQVTQDLNTTFGVGNYILEEITSTSFAVDTGYNGGTAQTMLVPVGNSLLPGASTDIVFRITILTEGTFDLTATGTGLSPDGALVSDISHNGSDPDPNHNDDPTEENDPTPVSTSCTDAVADAGANAQICAGDDYQIVDATVANESSFVWSTSGDGSFNSTGIISPVYTPGAADITSGTVTLTLTATSYGSCPNATDDMVISITNIVLTAPVITDASCDSNEDGSVQLAVTSGGTGSFTYELSIGESNNTGLFTTLAAGGYIYWVTDAGGCSVNGSFEIDDPNELELTITAENDITCFNGDDGSATVEATGGTTPYTFSWTGTVTQTDPTANPNTATDMVAGIYVVTVTDAKGCSEIETIEIEEPQLLGIILVDQINPDCDNSGQIIVSGFGGTTPYSFTSSAGSVSENIITGLSSGNVTVTITDANSCTNNIAITIVDEDKTAPTFACPVTQTLTTDANCQAQVPNLTALITATDNCSLVGDIVITQSIVANTLISSNIVVTVTATDEAGNSSSCDVLLELDDTTAPVANCKDITLQLDMTGIVHISAEDIDNGSTDNCGIESLSIDVSSFDCNDVATSPHTVTLTVTDYAGNTSTCTATVTIEDNIDPILDCPAPVTLIANGSCQAAIPNFAAALSNNNCGSATVTQDIDAGTPVGVGVTVVTVTATDSSDNTSTCTVDVTVVDETAPTFTCPVTQTLTTDANCQAQVPNLTALITATDNCSLAGDIVITQSIVTNTLISSNIVVTVTATDEAGNSSSCDVLLELDDTTVPVANCKDITLQLDMTGTVYISAEDIDNGSTDNCGIESLSIDVSSFTCNEIGDNPVVLTVTDDAGNTSTCTATVTIEDNIDPILDCPAPVTLVANGSCQAAIPDFAAALSNNNCGSATVTQDIDAGTPVGVGVTVVTVTATDSSDNTSTCTVDVTVVDETAPTFACPVTQTLTTDANCQAQVPNLTALITATDNCSLVGDIVITQSIVANTLISSNIVVTVTATDEAGNSSSCDVLLELDDTTAPVANCKDITLQLDMTGIVHISAEDIDNSSTDNCGIESLSIDVSSFTCNEIGDNPVVLTVTDDAGNTSTCTATVTIEDNVDPILDCPAPVILVADGSCQAAVPDFATALSNNNCGSATVSQDIAAGTPVGVGVTVVTVTATDDSGNTSTCTVEVTVVDETAPTFTCAPTQMLYGDINCQDTVPDLVALITNATDNCTGSSNLIVIQSIAAGTLISSDLTVTVSVSDTLGNSSECEVLLIMQDTTPPAAVCKNITLQVDMTGMVHISPEDVDGGSSDNCGLSSLSIDITSFTCNEIGDNPVVLTVTDDAGNTSTCTATVTIEDNIDPILDCPAPVILVADGSCQAAVPDFAAALSNNNCGSATVTQDIDAGTPVGIGVTVVTITATDVSGNTSTCTVEVTVVDETAPTFTCAPTQMLYGNINCQDTVPDLVALITNATDNCTGSSNLIVTQSITAGTLISSDLTVTVSVSDTLGNSSECEVLLIMQDTTPPTAVCKNITLQVDMTGMVHISPEDVDGGSSDNCGLSSLSIDITSFTCNEIGDNPVVLTVTDDAGNTSTCTATVTIEDNIDPILDCPAPVTLVANGSCQAAIPDFAAALSNNNCGSATVTQDIDAGTPVGVGVTVVTVTATDVSGNTSTCTVDVTVVDETVPTFTCPVTQTLTTDANCQAQVPNLTALITATDNCSLAGDIVITQSIVANTLISSNIVVTVTATDEAGNSSSCDILLELDDTTAPVANCKDITLQLDMTGIVHISAEDINNGSTDNCGIESLSIDVSSFTCNEIGDNPVVLTVTDYAGNTSTCTATVTIEDNIDPILDCPAPVTLIANGSCQAAIPDFAAALSSNNCGPADITQNPLAGAHIGLGVTIVNVTATDASGNTSTCTVEVTVVDETVPTISCPGIQYLDKDENCSSIVPNLTSIATHDNCSSVVTVTQSIAAGTTINSDITVTVTATDASGNSTSCDVLLLLSDNEPPTAVCKNITLHLDMTGIVHIGPEDIDGGSTDNCGLSSLAIDKSTFDCNDFGDNSVVLTVTDDARNISTCVATVTILDNIDPILDCPAPVTLGADGNCQASIPNFATALSSNNCGSAVITQNPEAGTLVGKGVTVVIITATDSEGNTSSCPVDITVIDTTPPQYNCPNPIAVNTDPGLCYSTINLIAPVVNDNCDGSDISIKYRIHAPNNQLSGFFDISSLNYEFMVGISQVEWVMTDKEGNVSVCEQEVVVSENEAPVIVCPTGSFNFSNTVGICGFKVLDNSLDATATDNCSSVTISHDYGDWAIPHSLEGATFPVGITTVIWTAIDASGNSSTCSIDITVTDNELPEFVNCPSGDSLTVALFSGACEGSAIWSIPIAQDNCNDVTVVQTDGPERGSKLGVGFYDIEYTATDVAGNSAVCSFTLEVTDTEEPIIVCQPNFTQSSDLGNCTWTAPEKSLTPLLTVSNCPFDISYIISGATIANGMNDASGETFNLGTSLVTYTVIEPISGQSWACSFSVTITDEESPVVSCADPILETNDLGMCSKEIVLVLPQVSDNCTNNTDISVIYSVFDPDNSIKGPFNGSQNIFEFNVGISQVEWTIEDRAGNKSTCLQEVTVNETENPIIICPENDIFNFINTPGLCGYKISDTRLDATASDNCGNYTLTHNFGEWALPNSLKGAIFPVGETDVVWTATDESGNSSSCTITVIVEDNESPEFANCSSGVTFTIGLFSGSCEGGAIWSIPVAFDNCSDVTVTQTKGPAQGTILAVGTYEIEYKATDAALNSTYCSFKVKVKDTEAPIIICQPNLIQESDEGTCSWTSVANSLSPLLANSNCPSSVVWEVTNPDGSKVSGTDDVSGYVFELGTSTINYSIEEDASSQSWDCSFTVTIVDNEAPVLDCQPALQITALPGDCSAEVELVLPVFTDNCTTEAQNLTYRVFGVDGSTSAILPASNLVFDFKPGNSRVLWEVTDEQGNVSSCWQDVMILIDTDALTPDAGENASICESDSFKLAGATAPDFATIEWTTSGTGYFINSSDVNAVYIASTLDIVDGYVILTITSSSDCESVLDQMILSISKSPIVYAGDDAVICEVDSYQLNGKIISPASSVIWETAGSGTFSDNQILNPLYTPSQADIENGEVQLIFKGISGGVCDNSADTMTLNIERQPIISAGTDGFICEGGGFAITDASVLFATEVEWTTNGTGTFNDNTIINPIYTPSEGDILNGLVELIVSNVSFGNCYNVNDKILLSISKHPTVNAGNNLSTCYGQQVIITGATGTNFTTVNWTTNGTGSIQQENTLNPTYIPADGETGIVKLQLTAIGESSCIIDTISDEINLEIYDKLLAYVGDDDTIFYNKTALLAVDVEDGSGSYFYNWQPASLVYDPSANFTETVKLTETTNFILAVTDVNTGCIAEDEKIVYVEESADDLLGFYNAFTPNSDGVNDTWIIDGIEKFPENEVLIFNRWGDKIKDLQNYDNETTVWDGTNTNDKPVPDGTYFYVVNLKDIKSYTGWITIRSEQ